MPLCDLTDPNLKLPFQIAIDSSLLLALRPSDDNPHAAAAQAFIRRLRPHIHALELVAWVPLPVIQECYHIILTHHLRRAWELLDPATRFPNWLTAYKHQPDLLVGGLRHLRRFDELLSAIPLTVVQPEDLTRTTADPLPERLRHYITAYQLLPQDAMILAETERLGVGAVATLDRDWRRLIEFDVFTVLTD
jgi:predicted nucleic acid-binding protein